MSRNTPLSLTLVAVVFVLAACTKEIPPPDYAGGRSVVGSPPPSSVHLPLEFPLDALDGTVRTRIPGEIATPGPGWQYPGRGMCDFGIGHRYGFRPGRFDSQIEGHRLTLTTRMGYWFRARRRVMADCHTHEEGSCGSGDRGDASIAAVVTSDLSWTPDWFLEADTRAEIDVKGRCRPHALGTDLTSRVAELAESALKRNLEVILQGFLPRRTDARPQAEQAWRVLHSPLNLGSEALRFSPSAIRGSSGGAGGPPPSLGIVVRPTVGSAGGSSPAPFPAFDDAAPPEGFHLPVEDELTLAAATAHLRRQIPQRHPSTGKPYLEVGDSTMTVSGDHVVLALTVQGAYKGVIYLAGRPTYDPNSDLLSLTGLAYSPETERIFAADEEDFDHVGFVGAVAAAARFPVGGRIQRARSQLSGAFPATLAEGARLEGRIDRASPLGVRLSPTALHPVAQLSGNLTLRLP